MSLTNEQFELINAHLEDVKENIIKNANSKIEQNGFIDIESLLAIATAFAQNHPIEPRKNEGIFSKITDVLVSVPGIIWISSLLAVTFGVLSLSTDSTSMSDLAKVFAGSIVGASGAGGSSKK